MTAAVGARHGPSRPVSVADTACHSPIRREDTTMAVR